MQITLELPDDVYRDAQTQARRESRSLASVLLDLIRSARRQAAPPAPEQGRTSWKLPVVKGARPFTEAEVAKMLEEDALP